MQRLFAIAKLTLKAAFRYRLVQVLIGLLLGAVLGLPAIIKHDGTAQGFTQILLTYTLGAITTLLGFATLWLACGTLARDVEECQMQMVAVKPIARWEIWAGKWTGIRFRNMIPVHLPAQISQRAIGFTATICIWHSSTSRASVPHASHSVAKPRSVVMAPSV